jgi:ATP synthase protein I
LVLFFVLGAGAGIVNVYRAVRGMGYQVGYRATGAKPAEKDAAEKRREDG